MKLTKHYKAWYYRKALALVQSGDFDTDGLCAVLNAVYNKEVLKRWEKSQHKHSETVTLEERNAMLNDFQNSKPSYWKPRTWRFLKHPTYTGGTFWWNTKEIEQRIKFLKYLIEKNS
jgi:hypothetical protein